MKQSHFTLPNNYTLSIEIADEKVRLIVLKNDTEWVCRKVPIKQLISDLKGDQNQLFKGRLQLHKSANKQLLQIHAKNEFLGTILLKDLLIKLEA